MKIHSLKTLALVATMATMTASVVTGQTTETKDADSKDVWAEAVQEMADQLTPELIKAFPELESEESAKLRPFLGKLKSTGFGAPPKASAEPTRGRRRRFNSGNTDFVKSLDQDKDGAVTRLELHDAIVAAIGESIKQRSSIDSDKNGEISKREYATSMPPKFGDVDEDGMDGHARGHFNREDGNKDGVLSLDEITKRYIAMWNAEIASMQLAVRIAAADSDSDKQLSSEEVTALLREKETSLPEAFQLTQPLPLNELYQKIRTSDAKTLEALDKVVR